MELQWYWPHAHERPDPVAAWLVGHGDTVVVEALRTKAGRVLPVDAAPYRLVRDLPEIRTDLRPAPRRVLASFATRVRWQVRRHRLARTVRPDVVHLQLLDAELDWWSLPRLRRASGAALVGVVHDVRPHVSRLPRPVEERLLRRLYSPAVLDDLLVYGQALADELVADFGVAPDRVHVVPMPIAEPPGPAPRRPGAPFTVLLFGTFRRNKGIEDLVAAVDRAAPRADRRYVIAGTGVRDVEQLVAGLARRRDDVTAEVGLCSEERKAELFAAADVVVMPYRTFHSQSAVLRDAYAHGVPVVVTDVGALGETVRRDGTGWVVPPADVAALSGALDTAERDPEAWRRCVERTVAAVDDLAPDRLAPRIRAVYEASSRRRSAR